ncbi:MAG: HIT domain-containing protein [archaeon]
MLPKNQIENIKKQLIQQISSTFPEDKKIEAVKQIKSMDENQLEEFLIQNNLMKTDSSADGRMEGSPSTQQCIFCSIVFGDIPSNKIDENNEAIAVLEINPISRGHTIIIPKEHLDSQDKFPQSIFEFAEKIKIKIKTNLKPKDTEIIPSNMFGHEILNVIPIYDNETINSQRQQAKPEELIELQNTLQQKPEPEKIEQSEIKELDVENMWLPKRIP